MLVVVSTVMQMYDDMLVLKEVNERREMFSLFYFQNVEMYDKSKQQQVSRSVIVPHSSNLDRFRWLHTRFKM